jgi:hypothetical protein
VRIWSAVRIKGARIAPREGTYEALPATPDEKEIAKTSPTLFKFKAISIGDDLGQAFIVPLDESSRKTAEYILRAIAAYKGE